ncbi:hypothetical protein QTJ16_005591 [Diplocarpon rosae]|uniref:Pleckstrin homology domain-containing protein n=1 Tax=Diplocarpon rosae TaxID=946125 RepID=A0AAD9SY82_9HELO|nr:hypothetical protein QTJ16_005591 [Diplocarpon rosae]
MNAWETEDECAAAAQASLPSPTATPRRTLSRGSRRSTCQKSNSPDPSSSPLPVPNDEKIRQGSKGITVDESISILDPRRFTPTLHANLVSEILALRRDQEDKIRTIELLESDLYHSRGDHEELDASLADISKENRSLKRQLTLLEGSSSSALRETARERDEAVESNSECKRRIETLQKKLRSQEENSDRTHELWARDRDNWEEEKRRLERKAHVAETRLKNVLDEVSTYQARTNGHQGDGEGEDMSKESVDSCGHGSDAGSIRSMSMTNSSIRFSTLSGLNGLGGIKLTGVSLADELDLHDEEDQPDHDGRDSVTSVRPQESQGRDSMVCRNQHSRTQSTESLMRPGTLFRGRGLAQQLVVERIEGGIMEAGETVPVKSAYTDTGIQFSPPPSPRISPTHLSSSGDRLPVNGIVAAKVERLQELVPRECEIEANQRRKRVHVTPPLTIDHLTSLSMVSSASQTLGDPLSPPWTPKSPTKHSLHPPIEDPVQTTTSISTQTDLPEVQTPLPTPRPRRAPPPSPVAIPSIQLHPPSSAPATPHEPLLPQYFRDAACQVAIRPPIPSRSISVQTEEIRVAQRIRLLPAHLQPSAISSTPPSPEPVEEQEFKRFSPVPGNLPPRNPRRMTSRANLEQDIPSRPLRPRQQTRDAYPGNNDDGPLTSKDQTSIRRPHRISSLFAGFDNVSSDDGDDFADGDVSDNDYRTALSAPTPYMSGHKSSQRISPPPVSVPENIKSTEIPQPSQELGAGDARHTRDKRNGDLSPEVPELPSRFAKGGVRQLDKPLPLASNSKPSVMRRAALIQSGVAAHQRPARSASSPETEKEPPFPIPMRASSRRPPFSASAPSDGIPSPTWAPRSGSYTGGLHRTNSIRRVRSAAAIARHGSGSYRRHGSRSPPPISAPTEASKSPPLHLTPSNDAATTRYMRETGTRHYRSHHRQQPSTNTVRTTNTFNTGTTSIGTANHATSVVEAIAQTMVGEWMYKYVRRRKSFGVPESNGIEGDSANGARHKRWVWLAPYERAVMWSSKQPTSGSALMGKAGRKLTIQSVLDVKDDNAPPRGSPALFNRSILILTPTRALKFTATSPERHYAWLTALSFLAHSSHAVPEIAQATLPLSEASIHEFGLPSQANDPARVGFRDSTRVARGKTVLARYGPTSIRSSQKNNSARETESISSHNEQIHSEFSAKPPVVPRFSERGQGGQLHISSIPIHGRKRSNTGGRIPPSSSFRGFAGPAISGHAPPASTTGLSVHITGSTDTHQSQSQPPSAVGAYTNISGSGRSSIRSSDASNRPGTVLNNFFDAVGTMRMEAFITPDAFNRFDDFLDEKDEMCMGGTYRRSSKERHRRNPNFYSTRGRPSDDFCSGSKTAGEEEYDYFDGECSHDPFRGF